MKKGTSGDRFVYTNFIVHILQHFHCKARIAYYQIKFVNEKYLRISSIEYEASHSTSQHFVQQNPTSWPFSSPPHPHQPSLLFHTPPFLLSIHKSRHLLILHIGKFGYNSHSLSVYPNTGDRNISTHKVIHPPDRQPRISKGLLGDRTR